MRSKTSWPLANAFTVAYTLLAWSTASSSYAGEAWIRITHDGDTLLKSSIEEVADPVPGKDICTLYAGSKVYLKEAPERLGNFYRVEVRDRDDGEHPIPGCQMSHGEAYVFAAHVTEVYPKEQTAWKNINDEWFSKTLHSELATSTRSRTLWSIDVRAYGPNGQKIQLFTYNNWKSVRPASNMKILTTWAAFYTVPEASQIGSRKFSYIRSMMKQSNNHMAHQVLKWAGGPSRIHSLMKSAGIKPSPGFRVIDGSGLSYSNRLSASNLVGILEQIRVSNKLEAFRATLPIGGEDGTLRRRLHSIRGRVVAKTGTLISDPAVALAGYVDGRNNSGKNWQLMFAILGDSVTSPQAGRRSIDGLLRKSVNYINQLEPDSFR